MDNLIQIQSTSSMLVFPIEAASLMSWYLEILLTLCQYILT